MAGALCCRVCLALYWRVKLTSVPRTLAFLTTVHPRLRANQHGPAAKNDVGGYFTPSLFGVGCLDLQLERQTLKPALNGTKDHDKMRAISVNSCPSKR